MIPGAADQLAGVCVCVCVLQKPVGWCVCVFVCVYFKSLWTQGLNPWTRGWWVGVGLSEMLESHLESSRTNGKRTDEPSQLWEHCYLVNKNSTCKSKLVLASGPLEFGNSRSESWPDPFFHHCGALLTADISLQAKLPFNQTSVSFQKYLGTLRDNI